MARRKQRAPRRVDVIDSTRAAEEEATANASARTRASRRASTREEEDARDDVIVIQRECIGDETTTTTLGRLRARRASDEEMEAMRSPSARARGRKRGRDDGVGASRTLVRFAGDGETADGGAEWIVRVDRDAFARVVACDAFVVRVEGGVGSEDGVRVRVCATGRAFDACAAVTRGDGYANGGNVVGKMTWSALAVVYDAMARESDEGGGAHRARAKSGLDLGGVFDAVRPNAATCPEATGEFPALEPTPRAYQRQAVAWMLARERASGAPEGALRAKRGGDVDADALHPLWRALPDGDGYINPYSGQLTKKKFVADYESVSGGILADEMGLGKTVEVIMLVLANRLASSALKDEDESQNIRANGATTTDVKVENADDTNDESMVVRCPCGAREDDGTFTGLWVECEKCNVWMHARCVGLCDNARAEARLMNMSEDDRDRKLAGFTCGKCIAAHASEMVDTTCGATLVVCPAAIIEQWRDEIALHVRPGTVNVITYEGQSQRSGVAGSIAGVYSARDLAEADIVLTTYDTLRTEIDIDTANGQGLAGAERARRYERKYNVVPTPLTRLTWWRVVLDEAQMVESTVSKAAEMVRRLPATHRWAVTGTPISRGLSDIFGLLTFLMVEPFAFGDYWWKRMIETPYMNGDAHAEDVLYDVLRGLMWRNSRADMEHQLGVPPQGELVTWLRSNAVEAHWYSQQYTLCASAADSALRPYCDHPDDASVDPQNAYNVMMPLLRLRQACDHPQAGSHGLAGGIRNGANVLTMDEISEKLVERARIAAEESQRLVAFTLNALAGLAWIEGDFEVVINAYREVLSIESQGKDRGIRLDALQRLHAYHNLDEALRRVKEDPSLLKGAKIGATLRDDSLARDAATERAKYITQRAGGVDDAQRELQMATAALKKQIDLAGVNVGHATWWIYVLEKSTQTNNEASNLLARVFEMFDGQWQDKEAPFDSVHGLRFTMACDLDAIEAMRKKVFKTLANITARVKTACKEDVRAIGTCSKCRKDTDYAVDNVTCMFCKAEPVFSKYESTIFGVRLRRMHRQNQNRHLDDKGAEEITNFVPHVSRYGRTTGMKDEDNNRGGPSSVEAVLRALLPTASWWQDRPDSENLSVQAKAHVTALEEIRKEFHKLSQLIVQQREELASHDELEMAVTRIRVRSEYEMPDLYGSVWKDPVPEGLRASIVHREEIAAMSVNYTQQKSVYDSDLRKSMSQLQYLESTLRRKADGADADADAETDIVECPICIAPFINSSTEICVWPCGHRTCVTCVLRLVRRARAAHDCVFCVTCRSRAHIDELMYVHDVGSHGGGQSPRDDYVRRGKGDRIEFLTDMLGDENELRDAESRIRVAGSWGTKIEAIIRRVKLLLARDDAAKILVFSEWDDVLNVVERAISANDVRYVRAASGPKFRAAVDGFKHDDNINALLLPLKRGAHGLNLTEAQHVLLLEPVLDPALEAQAIKRVDRIGQTKPTCVHRFLIRDTVEENVYKFSCERANAMSDLASDHSLQKRGADEGLTLGDLRTLLARPAGRLYVADSEAPRDESEMDVSEMRRWINTTHDMVQ